MNAFITKLPCSQSNTNKRKNGASSSNIKHLTSSAIAEINKKQKQMYLDFGQKSFGRTETCKKCLMTYIPIDSEDISRHKKHCVSKRNQPTLPQNYNDLTDYKALDTGPKTIKDSAIISINKYRQQSDCFRDLLTELTKEGFNCDFNFTSSSSTSKCYLCINTKTRHILGCAFFEQLRKSDTLILNKSQLVTDIVFATTKSIDIASHRSILDPPTHASSLSSSSQSVNSTFYGTELDHSHPLASATVTTKLYDSNQLENISPNRYSSCSTQINLKIIPKYKEESSRHGISYIKQEAAELNSKVTAIVLGVRLIWVSDQSRRHGVAKCLLDVARRTFFYGHTVTIGGISHNSKINGNSTNSSNIGDTLSDINIAFSQPTDDGRNLAFSYCQSDWILIYPGY